MPPEIHISDLTTFQNCRVRWDYSSPLRHNLQTNKLNKHLILGSAVHHALAAYYGSAEFTRDCTGLMPAYKAFVKREVPVSAPDYIHEYMQLGEGMLDHYLLWAREYDNFRIVVPEYTFHVEFPNFTFAGTIDGLIEDRSGLWILENKTYTRMPAMNTLMFSLQGLMYYWASRNDEGLKELGKRVKGVLYNILRKVTPTEPNRLKSGELTKKKSLLCSPKVYRQALRKYDLDEGPYEDYIATLDWSNFFQRYRLAYSPKRLEQGYWDFVHIVGQMLGKPAVYPADPMRACDWCDYRPLCELRLYGGNWEPLAAADYHQREVWYD